MATSTTSCISVAALFALAVTVATSSLPRGDEGQAQRTSGRADIELAYRGSGRMAARRRDSREPVQVAYRASGRMDLAYRGSERGVESAQKKA